MVGAFFCLCTEGGIDKILLDFGKPLVFRSNSGKRCTCVEEFDFFLLRNHNDDGLQMFDKWIFIPPNSHQAPWKAVWEILFHFFL